MRGVGAQTILSIAMTRSRSAATPQAIRVGGRRALARPLHANVNAADAQPQPASPIAAGTAGAHGRAVEFLEDNEICQWANMRGLPCESASGFTVQLPDIEAGAPIAYAAGRRSGREAAAARDLVRSLGEWDECLAWIRRWGVWPSSEDWPAFYAWRALDKAPGHRFDRHERPLLIELVTLMMENAWDADVLCCRRGRADGLRAKISHDEWYQIFAPRLPSPE